MSDQQPVHFAPITLEFVEGTKGRVPLGFFKIPAHASAEYFTALAQFMRVAAAAVSEDDVREASGHK